jgi:hypothetical protein
MPPGPDCLAALHWSESDPSLLSFDLDGEKK